LQSLVSDFFIYNSTGRLISGGQDTNEHSNLAKQIDAKRNALYFELMKKGTVLVLGCSVRVEQIGGREERIVCIGVCSGFRGHENDVITGFYERVIAEIKNIPKFDYRIVGLWNENDHQDFGTLQDIDLNEDITEYILGKLAANEHVSVKSKDTLAAVSVISNVFKKLQGFSGYDLKFTASQYPYETDMSVCPIEPNPDLELDTLGLNWKAAPAYNDYYRIISKVFGEYLADEENQQTSKTWDALSSDIKKLAFHLYKKEVLDHFSASQSMNKLFDLYKHDKDVLMEIFKEKPYQIESMIIEDEIAIANIIILCSQSSSNLSFLDHNSHENASIKSLFSKIRNQKIKRNLEIKLLENGIFLSYAIKDTVSRIYNEDTVLLNRLCGIQFKQNDRRKEKFKKYVNAALSSLQNEQLIEVLRFTANSLETTPAEGGRIFHDSIRTLLYTQAHDFAHKLSRNEAKLLDSYFGSSYSSQKKSRNNKSRKKVLIIGSFILIFCLFIATMTYFLMPGVFPGENSSTKDARISEVTGKLGSFIPFLAGKEVSGNESVNFTAHNTSNPFEFQFADHTPNATVWEWDVDGDGNIDSHYSSFNYTYNETGTYNVSLNVLVDNNISLSGTSMINVPRES